MEARTGSALDRRAGTLPKEAMVPWTRAHEAVLHCRKPQRLQAPIFTEMEPLRRARMPRDAMWWHAEQIRTGMTPLPEEVVLTEPVDEETDPAYTMAM